MTYRELQQALKEYRDQGYELNCMLNECKDILKEEYDRIVALTQRSELEVIQDKCDEYFENTPYDWNCVKQEVWEYPCPDDPDLTYYSSDCGPSNLNDIGTYLGYKYCIQWCMPGYLDCSELYVGDTELEVMREFYDIEVKPYLY